MSNNVNHPSHYTQGSIECIDAIKSALGDTEFYGYLRGNAIKYLWRYEQKGGGEDLRKAMWYTQRLFKEKYPEKRPNDILDESHQSHGIYEWHFPVEHETDRIGKIYDGILTAMEEISDKGEL